MIASSTVKKRPASAVTDALTPPEHSAAIDQAADFLRAVPPGERPKPLVPALREMFGLSPIEACEAILASHRRAA